MRISKHIQRWVSTEKEVVSNVAMLSPWGVQAWPELRFPERRIGVDTETWRLIGWRDYRMPSVDLTEEPPGSDPQ